MMMPQHYTQTASHKWLYSEFLLWLYPFYRENGEASEFSNLFRSTQTADKLAVRKEMQTEAFLSRDT